MFPIEVLIILSKRDIDFTVEVVSRATPMSKTPYKMSTPELEKMKSAIKKVVKK